ncbi:MAG: serine hydrolase [Spirochaetales bacterium]
MSLGVPLFARGPYLLRALGYTRAQRKVGAFGEYQLFAAVDLAPSGALGQRTFGGDQTSLPLSSTWQARLEQTSTKSFVVVRGGEVTRQWTAPGILPSQPGRLYSLTKSLLSVAIGIALDEGLFPPLETPVAVDRHGAQLTPRQLLRMDSGLEFHEGMAGLNHQSRTYLHPDGRRTALASRVVDKVSQDFHYNDYNTLLLGLLLERGLKAGGWKPADPNLPLVAAWVHERLLLPLGQADAGHFVLDSARHRFPKPESGLCLSALDVARVGQLVLQGGVWNGQQLVSAAWLALSTGRTDAWQGAEAFRRYDTLAWGPWLSQGRGFYAYHWWGSREASGPDTVFALGYHGQVMVISPRHNAVVVRLADRWALKDWWPDVILQGLESGEL